jgi:hypothetical protein
MPDLRDREYRVMSQASFTPEQDLHFVLCDFGRSGQAYSSMMSLSNWAGDPGSGVPPRSAKRALILGSASAALTSLLSFRDVDPATRSKADDQAHRPRRIGLRPCNS